ncbi:MAG: 2-phosphosulfolactate phosphatase [Desulfobacterales bacterium]|nr:2-phosphosulfolactate phosphatase [Desulfobacterales bacterium]
MKIIRKSCATGAEEAVGLAVIIDVFRAFTCEPLFFHFGVRRSILEADPMKARKMKKEHPEYILAGEIDEVPIEDGDLGNSPSQIVLKGRSFFEDKVVIHRTTAGVTGASSALEHADEVLLGGFTTAGAAAAYIRYRNPRVVTLVAMGSRGRVRSPEDERCADYLEHLLTGKPYDPIQTLKETLFHPSAQKFLTCEKPYLPREDPVFCLQHDVFDFALTARKEEGLIVVRPTSSPDQTP